MNGVDGYIIANVLNATVHLKLRFVAFYHQNETQQTTKALL